MLGLLLVAGCVESGPAEVSPSLEHDGRYGDAVALIYGTSLFNESDVPPPGAVFLVADDGEVRAGGTEGVFLGGAERVGDDVVLVDGGGFVKIRRDHVVPGPELDISAGDGLEPAGSSRGTSYVFVNRGFDDSGNTRWEAHAWDGVADQASSAVVPSYVDFGVSCEEATYYVGFDLAAPELLTLHRVVVDGPSLRFEAVGTPHHLPSNAAAEGTGACSVGGDVVYALVDVRTTPGQMTSVPTVIAFDTRTGGVSTAVELPERDDGVSLEVLGAHPAGILVAAPGEVWLAGFDGSHERLLASHRQRETATYDSETRTVSHLGYGDDDSDALLQWRVLPDADPRGGAVESLDVPGLDAAMDGRWATRSSLVLLPRSR